MKKILAFLIILALAISGTVLIKINTSSAKSSTQTKITKTINNSSTINISTAKVKTFTLAQLKKYNGQNGNPAYVAVDGTVYDVTSAWGGGFHHGVTAGADVSKDINRSPHGKSVLKKLPVVGKLVK